MSEADDVPTLEDLRRETDAQAKRADELRATTALLDDLEHAAMNGVSFAVHVLSAVAAGGAGGPFGKLAVERASSAIAVLASKASTQK